MIALSWDENRERTTCGMGGAVGKSLWVVGRTPVKKGIPFQSAYKTSVQEIVNNPDLPAQISNSAANIPSVTNQSVVFRVSSAS